MDSKLPPLPPDDRSHSQEVDTDELHFVNNDASHSVGEAVDEGTGRIFPCEQCGADLRFHIGEQKLHCQFCGHTRVVTFSPQAEVSEQDLDAMLERLREFRQTQSPDDDDDRQEVRCESCGGNVEFQGTLTSRDCPYCDSPVQLDKVHKASARRVPVDGVLPFQIERPLAMNNLKAWVQGRWFAPSNFKKRGVDGELNGVYLSFFTYDSMTYSEYTGERGEYYYESVRVGGKTQRKRRTRWHDVNGRFQRFFDDVLIGANDGLAEKHVHSLEPWPLVKVVPFNQQLIAGHFSRTYDIPLDECFQAAKKRIDSAIHQDVIQRIGGDTQRVSSLNSKYEAVTYKHLLLPVWLFAYRYKDKPYQVFVNASTGEVQGDRPWSVAKIVLTVIGALAVFGGIAAVAGMK